LPANARFPLRIDDDWAEIDFGDWDGREINELRAGASTADALTAIYSNPDAVGPPGGETWHALKARIARAFERCSSRLHPPACSSSPTPARCAPP
jgi:alpha-ribazole phosphatase